MLEAATGFLDGIFSLIYTLLTMDFSSFSATAYDQVSAITGAMRGLGLGLCVTCFCFGLFQAYAGMFDSKNPTLLFRAIIRFLLTNAACMKAMQLIVLPLFELIQRQITRIFTSTGYNPRVGLFAQFAESGEGMGGSIIDLIPGLPAMVNLLPSIITLLFLIALVISGVVLLLTVIGRFLKIGVYIAFAPVPIAFFAGGSATSQYAKNYCKNLSGVGIEGAAIAVAIILFAAITSDNTIINTVNSLFLGLLGDLAPMAVLTMYMTGLTAMVKGSDALAHKLLGFM